MAHLDLPPPRMYFGHGQTAPLYGAEEMLAYAAAAVDAAVAAERESVSATMARYESMLFERGAMLIAPCFCCGYNGPGYFDPSKHACAERHHSFSSLWHVEQP